MKVIIYEGLFGILLGSKMSKAFEQAMPGHPYERRSWTSKKSIPEGAIVLSHSFGAYRAWNEFTYKQHKALITVDLRWWSKNEDYTRKVKTGQFHFFQLSNLRGYRLAIGPGQDSGTNLGYYGHMKAPSHPRVIEKIREVCK